MGKERTKWCRDTIDESRQQENKCTDRKFVVVEMEEVGNVGKELYRKSLKKRKGQQANEQRESNLANDN